MPLALGSAADDPLRETPAEVPGGANRVTARIVERGRQKLVELGFDPADAFPARLVRDLLPTHGRRRMCLEAVYRAIARGHLEASRIGREWFTTIDSVELWISRRSHGAGTAVETANDPTADVAHAALRARLVKRRHRDA